MRNIQCKMCLDIFSLRMCKCGRVKHMGKAYIVQRVGTNYGFKFNDYVIMNKRDFIYKCESD
jgi:hypothetical protein